MVNNLQFQTPNSDLDLLLEARSISNAYLNPEAKLVLHVVALDVLTFPNEILRIDNIGIMGKMKQRVTAGLAMCQSNLFLGREWFVLKK